MEKKKIRKELLFSASKQSTLIPLNITMMKESSMTPREDDIISIRPFIIYGGYITTLITVLYCIVVATLFPNTSNEGKLLYISEGLAMYCGWSIVVLGICSTFTMVCQAIAVCHMEEKLKLSFLLLLEIIGWYSVMGIEGTGWTFHYVALVLFLIGNVGYHWISSRDNAYGGAYYKAVNFLAIFFILLFFILNRISDSFKHERELKSFSASVEYILSIMLGMEQLFLLNGLDQYENIHINFIKKVI